MGPVSSTGSAQMAMSMAQWSSTAQGGGLQAVAQDPTPENISAADEAASQDGVAMNLLKKTLSIDLTNADAMAKLMGQGSRLDVYA